MSRLWRAALLSVAAGAALSVVEAIPLMGLPGAVSLVLATPVLAALCGAVDVPRDSA